MFTRAFSHSLISNRAPGNGFSAGLSRASKTLARRGCDERVELIDFVEQRLKSDPVARKIFAMEETATLELDAQALEQILIGHVTAITGEANRIFRELTKFDCGIDGEIEFKADEGRASGRKVYVQLKSGNSYLRKRQRDERVGESSIRWMNVTKYLRERGDKASKQIVFEGEALTMQAVWRVRDGVFWGGAGVALNQWAGKIDADQAVPFSPLFPVPG